jgi:septal ring factor EnvC (AmiA/AmiB activator)
MPNTVAAALVLFLLTAGLALAQTTASPVQPAQDPQFMQNAIEALRQQRSNAEDQAASLAAQLASTRMELAKVQGELEKMKKPESTEPVDEKKK